jgi:hypothetical protein
MRRVLLKTIVGSMMTLVWGLSGIEAQQAGGVLDKDLQTAIEKEYPNAIIPTKYDVAPCPVPTHHPAWIKADFNGDGRPDHAVLLNIENKEGVGMGKTYDSILIVFLREPSGMLRAPLIKKVVGGFRVLESQNRSSLMVTEAYIEKKPAGIIKGLGKNGNKTGKLINPGILVSLCEKWEYVWYWNAKESQFKELYEEYYGEGPS